MPFPFWNRTILFILGAWLFASPAIFYWLFSYNTPNVGINDALCGIIMIVLAALLNTSFQKKALIALFALGVWLQLAPLVFWAPFSLQYFNDTLSSVVAIACVLAVPDKKSKALMNNNPPGWNYNPSAWIQRIPIIVLGTIAWLAAHYMASYQLGYRSTIWDPFFGDDGTLAVITSDISKSFPVSDAGLGAIIYTLEVLLCFKGGEKRWYTMPWTVISFGFLVIPLGLASVTLIVLQPVIVGHWCTWCLLTAFCMLLIVALAVDEVAAVFQLLSRAKKEKKPLWPLFWNGGPEQNIPLLPGKKVKQGTFAAMIEGLRFSWKLFGCALIGISMFLVPPFFRLSPLAGDFDYILGAFIVVISVISFAKVLRPIRWSLIALGFLIPVLNAIFYGQAEYGWREFLVHLGLGVCLAVLAYPKKR